MKESERLRAAKALIDTPEKWMQGEYHDLPGDVKNSRCFCALGAIRRVHADLGEGTYGNSSKANFYLEDALEAMDADEADVPSFNDTHTHEEVMQMFDKAIKIAESEGN